MNKLMNKMLAVWKYDFNGTPKKNFKGTKPSGTSCGPKIPALGGSSYVQQSTKIDKLEKSNKNMKYTITK